MRQYNDISTINAYDNVLSVAMRSRNEKIKILIDQEDIYGLCYIKIKVAVRLQLKSITAIFTDKNTSKNYTAQLTGSLLCNICVSSQCQLESCFYRGIHQLLGPKKFNATGVTNWVACRYREHVERRKIQRIFFVIET